MRQRGFDGVVFAVAIAPLVAVVVSVSALALPGARATLPGMRASIAIVSLTALFILLAPAVILSLTGSLSRRVAWLLSSGPARGRLRLMWIAGGGVLALIIRALLAAFVTDDYDLPEPVATLIAAPASGALLWAGHRLATRRRGPRLAAWEVGAGAVALSMWWMSALFTAAPRLQPLGCATAVACAALMLAPLWEQLRTARRPKFLLMALALLLFTDAFVGPVARATDNPMGRSALRIARFFADRDGDGFAALFAGGDCREGDPSIHPLAVEIVGNGRDDNCWAGDLERATLPVVDRPTWSQTNVDVVMISIDALRASALDHMPVLSARAASGRRFTRGYTAAPLTDASLRAVFTGWPVSDFDHGGELVGMARPIADILSELGFATFALHSIGSLGELITLGFQRENRTNAAIHERTERSAPQLTEIALSLLRSPSQQPRLLWLHYLEPHRPYLAHSGFADHGDSLAGRYHQEVAFVDRAMTPLLDHLSRPEVARRTIVILFADHGEYLGEGGRFGHDYTLYEPVTRVPVIVWAPSVAGAVIDTPVSLLDIFPTVVDLLAIEGVAPRAGVSLLTPRPGRALISEARGTNVRTPTLALRQDQILYHCAEAQAMCELCQIDVDPVCTRDLQWQRPELARHMRDQLGALLDHYRNDQRYRVRSERFYARYAR